MTEDQLCDLIEPALRSLGCTVEPGEEFEQPPLEVVRFGFRQVRLSWVPLIGRSRSVVAVVRQPADVAFSPSGYKNLIIRVARVANAQAVPGRSLSIGLTTVVLSPEPIGPGDDAILSQALDTDLRRYRAIGLGLLRVNLGLEATSYALKASPGSLFLEAERLADVFSERLKRFVPLLET